MTLAVWAAFAVTEFGLSLVPGPAVLLVCTQALRSGFPAGARTALGIIAGNIVYFALAAAGLGALLVASNTLFEVIKIAGAAYLVWLGLRMLFQRRRATNEDAPTQQPRSFTQGLLTQLGNPKALVFFTALLPQFISSADPLVPQFALLAATSISLELPILLVYSYLAATGRDRLRRGKDLTERASGAILVGLGVRLVT